MAKRKRVRTSPRKQTKLPATLLPEELALLPKALVALLTPEPPKRRKPKPKRKRASAIELEMLRLFEAEASKPTPKPRATVQSKGLRGRLEGKKVYAGTRVGKRGWRIHPSGARNRHYEVYFFLKEPASKEIAAKEINAWLEERKLIVREWFNKTEPKGQKFHDTLFVRFGTWVFHPETKEYRKAFDQAFDGTDPDLFRDLDASHFIDIVPVKYFDEGYLLAGLELYFFTASSSHPSEFQP